MRQDPVLKQLIREAAKKFDVPEKLINDIILEEKLRRYQMGSEKRFIEEKLRTILEEYIAK